jgi:hypothetical protein
MGGCQLGSNPRPLEGGARPFLNAPPSTSSDGGATSTIGLPTLCFASRIYMCFACQFLRSSSIIYCGGTLTLPTLIQTHTISTGINGRNLGPVSTTNGL